MAVDAMKRGAVDFIHKPFRDQELLDPIHEALNVDAGKRSAYANLEEVRNKIDSLPREHEVYERIA